MQQAPGLENLLATLRDCGGTDEAYLEHHFERFVHTKREFCSGWDRRRGVRVLDVGAHWLHQSALWTADGYQVTAVDMPITFEMPQVATFARREGIRLVPCADLEAADALQAIESDSIDIMLFTEIIEHITFNPVRFWKQVYRILAPGARIVVTTPNYYALQGRAWDIGRFTRGFGGGLGVDGILNMRTYAHHWKEYSMREVIYYFCLLSTDFNTVKRVYPSAFGLTRSSRAARAVERRIAPLRPNLHVEIELVHKRAGITLEPAW